MHHEDTFLFTKENDVIHFVEEYKIREIYEFWYNSPLKWSRNLEHRGGLKC